MTRSTPHQNYTPRSGHRLVTALLAIAFALVVGVTAACALYVVGESVGSAIDGAIARSAAQANSHPVTGYIINPRK